MENIDLFIGIFLQDKGHDRHMPRMFRIIFPAAAAKDMGLPVDFLFFVDLQQKIQLFSQSFIHPIVSCLHILYPF